MPLYEFECEQCGNQFEELKSSTDTSSPECPSCHQTKTKKLVSAGFLGGSGSSGGGNYVPPPPSCSVGG
mgnify:CR=1 FL=1